MHLVLDNKQEIHQGGLRSAGFQHALPRFLRHRLSDAVSFNDGAVDVLLFTELSKLELLGYAAQEIVGVEQKTRASDTFRRGEWISKQIRRRR